MGSPIRLMKAYSWEAQSHHNSQISTSPFNSWNQRSWISNQTSRKNAWRLSWLQRSRQEPTSGLVVRDRQTVEVTWFSSSMQWRQLRPNRRRRWMTRMNRQRRLLPFLLSIGPNFTRRHPSALWWPTIRSLSSQTGRWTVYIHSC